MHLVSSGKLSCSPNMQNCTHYALLEVAKRIARTHQPTIALSLSSPPTLPDPQAGLLAPN